MNPPEMNSGGGDAIRQAMLYASFPLLVVLGIAIWKLGFGRDINPVMAIGLFVGSSISAFLVAMSARES